MLVLILVYTTMASKNHNKKWTEKWKQCESIEMAVSGAKSSCSQEEENASTNDIE